MRALRTVVPDGPCQARSRRECGPLSVLRLEDRGSCGSSGDVRVGVKEGGIMKKSRKESGEKKLKNKFYNKELEQLQIELVKLQEWVKAKGLRVVVLFEGRDAAGKGGVIKRITQAMNPRICRVVALGVPTEKEKTQWYFQRYVAQLPAAGEMVLFDRSWYNRAGVEHVMGFCTKEQYQQFLKDCPAFEKMLIESGIVLIKYWFSISDEEQEVRFQKRNTDPLRRWKLSPMDMTARTKWVDYSKAKDAMFKYTDRDDSSWFVVEADDKKRARLNCIHHLLSLIPYRDRTPGSIKLPPRQKDKGYRRPPLNSQRFIPKVY
ncbi:MAG: polyphosphate kinase 2 [Elusimicrobia bacterium]|nr:polyphosphate kinase 2 [Elusimicrobiota bacterium]